MKNMWAYVDLRKPDPMTDSTALHIASTSKTFTAMAILRLVQENKCRWMIHFQNFFPDFLIQVLRLKCC